MTDDRWLIMVYIAGDNNLSDEGVYALLEMKMAATSDRIKIFAQFDPRDRRFPTQRYEINKNGAPRQGAAQEPGSDRLTNDRIDAQKKGKVKFPRQLKGVGRTPQTALAASERPKVDGDFETNTGDPETLFDFISSSIDSAKEFAPTRYMVVIAGHSAGVQANFLLRDENPDDTLSISGLRSVFEAVKSELKITVDILGMDSCLMSMAEICYEFYDLVGYIVGSQSYGPLAGWPYQDILKALDADLYNKGGGTPESLARRIIEKYIEYYSEYSASSGLSVDMAAMDVSAAVELAKKVKALTKVLSKQLSEPKFIDQIVLAHWEAQSYNGERFVDLYDFCDRLGRRYRAGGVPAACKAVKDFISKNLVVLSCPSGIDYQYSFGVSIYFPWAIVVPDYDDFGFAQETGAGWFKFLTSYTEATRREPRGTNKNSKTLLDVSTIRKTTLDAGTSLLSVSMVRKTPQDGRGTGEVVVSMRNPPLSLAEEGVGECLKKKPEIIQQLRSVSVK